MTSIWPRLFHVRISYSAESLQSIKDEKNATIRCSSLEICNKKDECNERDARDIGDKQRERDAEERRADIT